MVPLPIIEDLGFIDFSDCLVYQEKLFNYLIQYRQSATEVPNYLLLCEHPHVITLGKSGNTANLLAKDDLLKKKGVSFYHISRGGDITYHGPGQLVVYPIINLNTYNLTVRRYVELLEQTVINLLSGVGITATRMDGATGIWIDAGITGKCRKICAIGIRVSHQVTMHGLAFNVNTDLSYFNLINPCGLTGRGVTSLAAETGKYWNMDVIKKLLTKTFSELLCSRQ